MSDKPQSKWMFGGREIPAPKFECDRVADGWRYRVTYYLPRLFPDPMQKGSKK